MESEVRRAYAVLGLSPPVAEATVKRQYRRLAKLWHPDRHSSDPVGREEAARRMREINDAYHRVSENLRLADAVPAGPPAPVASANVVSGLSRQNIEQVISAINQGRAWTLPRMSKSRWLSLAVLLGYTVLPQVILPTRVVARPEISRAVGMALGYFWLPLFLIWIAEADRTPVPAERVFKTIGWILMAAPAVVGATWILWLQVG
jgi:DnaJ-like protein